MKLIEYNKVIYAGMYSPTELDLNKKGSVWFGKETNSLQGSIMNYDKKDFAIHKHILNPRLINHTQEAFIVVQGSIKIDIHDDYEDGNGDKKVGLAISKGWNGEEYAYLGSFIAKEKDIIFVWKGYHSLKFLEDNTIAYEIKAGAFNGIVSEDKKIIKLKESVC